MGLAFNNPVNVGPGVTKRTSIYGLSSIYNDLAKWPTYAFVAAYIAHPLWGFSPVSEPIKTNNDLLFLYFI